MLGPKLIDWQLATRKKAVVHELKLLCGMGEHYADPPMFVFRILLMVLD